MTRIFQSTFGCKQREQLCMYKNRTPHRLLDNKTSEEIKELCRESKIKGELRTPYNTQWNGVVE